MYNAFYYQENYYLLPQGCTDYRDFLGEVSKGPFPVPVQAVLLRENHGLRNFSVQKGVSMAPYFLSGYNDLPGTVMISDLSDLYPVQVEICTQEEYNGLLREKILEYCPGCLRYKPLSNRVQSLNGHFEEMAPDGVCLFRQDAKPSPRAFHDHLFSFGGFYRQFDYQNLPAQEMQQRIKQWFYVRLAGAELHEEDGRKILTLALPRKELLLPVILDAVSRYLYGITGGRYRICHTGPIQDMKAYLDSVLSEANRETFQKDCKKCGVSIGVLEYAPEASDKVRRSLKPLVDHYWMFPLYQEAGREYYLIADTSHVLKELRYRSPMLETFQSKISVYSQYGSRRYDISFAMPATQI